MISELLANTKRLLATIRKLRAVNVNGESLRQEAIDLGAFYFKNCRNESQNRLAGPAILAEYDEQWQNLLRLAHGSNSKNSYLKLLKRLVKTTTEIAIIKHTRPVIPANGVQSQPQGESEVLLLTTLDELIPTAAQSYRQGLQDINNEGHRLSFRGTACEFREALRETLDTLAPDASVEEQPWFNIEPNTTKPTMKQKVRFILSSRERSKTQRVSAEKSVDLIDNLCGEVTRAVYDRASLSTHVQSTKQEVIKMKRYLDAVLLDILEVGQKSSLDCPPT
jgi:hypothetical protein